MEASNNYLVVKKDVIEEKVSSGGIILNVSSAFTQEFIEEFENRNIVYAEVMYANLNIPFLKAGDRCAFNPHKGTKATMEYEELTILTKEQVIAKIDGEGKFIVPPDSVMVKMSKVNRDALFSKWVVRDDGSKVQLFLQSEPDKMDSRRSAIYVNVGEVTQVGTNIVGIKETDIAILDYTVDNFTDNVLYYDDEGNKYVVVDGNTTYHQEDLWVYANRKMVYDEKSKQWYRQNPKDTCVIQKGDLDVLSPILGIIRGEELIARQPYVFLNHENNVVNKKSKSGITYVDEEEVMERNVLSVSEISQNKYGVKEGKNIIVSWWDIFDINFQDGYSIHCVMDKDILMLRK